MRAGISIEATVADRARMEAIVADRGSPQNHVWRCRIVLLTAAGRGTNAIMREAGVAKTAVWRWQERFMQEGVDSLLRDKTRPPGKPPLPIDVVDKVVALTQTEPSGETTHWTAPMMAQATGISASSVQRIWKAHGLAPHRFRRFKLSNDPHFAAKLRDIVGLGACPRAGQRPDPRVDPPAHAIVYRSTRRARSRRSTAPSRACR